jgi:hypothetical protein
MMIFTLRTAAWWCVAGIVGALLSLVNESLGVVVALAILVLWLADRQRLHRREDRELVRASLRRRGRL